MATSVSGMAFGTTRHRATPSSTPRNTGIPQGPARGVQIHPLERLGIHEVYVRNLYPLGHGFPCANPKPLLPNTPAKIGDIGFLTDRFQVILNLFDVPKSIFGGQSVPVVGLTGDPRVFRDGDTVIGGINGCTVELSDDEMYTKKMTFTCQKEEGAILAITSPAELSEQVENETLRKFLCVHAEQLFTYLTDNTDKWSIPAGSSIYIVTGTIRSKSWAIATHDSRMNSPHDILVLQRTMDQETRSPCFRWMVKGDAQTLAYDGDHKDQTLFLKGFLLTASPDVWRAREEASKLRQSHVDGTDHSEADSVRTMDHNTNNQPSGARNPPGTASSRTTSSGSLPPAFDNPGKIIIDSVPSQSLLPDCYPSYRINQILLNFAKSRYAISHDTDWMDALKTARAGGGMRDEPSHRTISNVGNLISERIVRVDLRVQAPPQLSPSIVTPPRAPQRSTMQGDTGKPRRPLLSILQDVRDVNVTNGTFGRDMNTATNNYAQPVDNYHPGAYHYSGTVNNSFPTAHNVNTGLSPGQINMNAMFGTPAPPSSPECFPTAPGNPAPHPAQPSFSHPHAPSAGIYGAPIGTPNANNVPSAGSSAAPTPQEEHDEAFGYNLNGVGSSRDEHLGLFDGLLAFFGHERKNRSRHARVKHK